MTDGDGAPEVGTAAEEAARLFDAICDWVRRTSGATSDHIATGSPECRLCPFCQLLTLLRDTRPEVFAHLGDAGASLVAALRAVVESHEREWAGRRPAAFQHIDVR